MLERKGSQSTQLEIERERERGRKTERHLRWISEVEILTEWTGRSHGQITPVGCPLRGGVTNWEISILNMTTSLYSLREYWKLWQKSLYWSLYVIQGYSCVVLSNSPCDYDKPVKQHWRTCDVCCRPSITFFFFYRTPAGLGCTNKTFFILVGLFFPFDFFVVCSYYLGLCC